MEEAIKGRIIVVDDDASIRELITAQLHHAGHEVFPAENGAQALQLIEKSEIDMLLLDIAMPGMDGYKVLKAVRKTHSFTELPVIMVTARAEDEEFARSLGLGANDFLTKPIKVPILLARVKTQLALKQAWAALQAANEKLQREDTERKQSEESLRKDRDYLEKLHHSLGDAVFTVNLPERVITFANRSVFSIFGFEPAECLGQSTEMFFPDRESYSDFGARLQSAIENDDEILHTEMAFKRKTGRLIPCDVTISFFRVNGEVRQVISIVRDVSDRKQAEAKLQEAHDELEQKVKERTVELENMNSQMVLEIAERKQAEEKLQEMSRQNQLILDAAGEGIYGLDLAGKTTFVNPAAAEMIGWRGSELIGKSQHAVLHHSKSDGSPYPAEECPIYRAFSDGKVHRVDDEVFWRKDGSSFPVEYISTPITDENGHLAGAVVAYKDITLRKQAEKELAASERTLRHIHDYAIEGIFRSKLDGTILYANETMAKIFGYDSVEEFMATNMVDHYYDPADRAEVIKAYEERNALQNYKLLMRHRDGSDIWLLCNSTAIHDDDGEILWLEGFLTDITGLHLAEEALRTREEELTAIFESSTDGILVVDHEGKVVHSNQRFADMWRIPKSLIQKGKDEELLNFVLEQLVDPQTFLSKVQALYESSGEDHDALLFKDGRVFDRRSEPWILRNELAGRLWVFHDITEQRLAEELLRDSEERYRAIFEEAADSIVLVDADTGKLLEFNNKAYENLGYTNEEFAKLKISDIDIIETVEEVAKHIETILKEGSDAFETKHRSKDGEIRDIHVSSRAISLHGKRFVQSIWRDISAEKRSEEQLQKSHDQLRRLSAHLQSTREEERKAVAREIHDELGQALTALKMDIFWLRERFPDSDKSLLGKLDSMSGLADDSLLITQRISTELRPELLDTLGLKAAVEWQVEEFQKRTAIECELSIETSDAVIDQNRSIAIYRVLQEALTNVMRHAAATKVNVSLDDRSGSLELKVLDNGKGITRQQLDSPLSLGLIGMRERLIPWGGQIEIKGRKGQGTSLTATVSLIDA